MTDFPLQFLYTMRKTGGVSMKYVYIDILFLINFFIDLNLLLFTAIYSNQKLHKLKLLLAALVGAFYGAMWVIYTDSFVYTIIGKLLMSLILVRIAFPWSNIKVYLKLLVAFYIINFMAAGAVFTAQMVLLSQKHLYAQWIQFDQHNVWMLETTVTAILLGIPMTFLAVKQAYLYLKKTIWRKSWVFQCHIVYNGHKVSFRGLIDTGNQLLEPMTQRPVSIVEYGMVKEILPSFVNTMYANQSLNMASFHQLFRENALSDRFTLIPYRGLDNDGSYLLGLRPDMLMLETKEGMICNKESVIAITTQVLSSSNDFSGIIHPYLLDENGTTKEEIVNENVIQKNTITGSLEL